MTLHSFLRFLAHALPPIRWSPFDRRCRKRLLVLRQPVDVRVTYNDSNVYTKPGYGNVGSLAEIIKKWSCLTSLWDIKNLSYSSLTYITTFQNCNYIPIKSSEEGLLWGILRCLAKYIFWKQKLFKKCWILCNYIKSTINIKFWLSRAVNIHNIVKIFRIKNIFK